MSLGSGAGRTLRYATRAALDAADANKARDWRIYAELAQRLIAQARRLYANEDLGFDLANTVYALDSTTIDLCLAVFTRHKRPILCRSCPFLVPPLILIHGRCRAVRQNRGLGRQSPIRPRSTMRRSATTTSRQAGPAPDMSSAGELAAPRSVSVCGPCAAHYVNAKFQCPSKINRLSAADRR